MAQFSRSTIPPAYNEVMRDYPAGSEEAIKLKAACDKMRNECPEIPCVVGGKEIKTGDVKKQLIPSDNKHVLATFHQANSSVLQQAVDAALAAKTKWEEMPFDDRAAIFLKAADLLSKKYKYEILAATMLGQGKTVWQAEIDACAEVVDFWRFNVQYAQKIYEMQPDKHSQTVWNKVEYRPLEGYVVAISPFNFTAIGANLPSSPALMGNVILWKPASTAMLSNWILFKILREAGLPDGVINFLPGSGALIGDTLLNSKYFAGLHFTGSTGVFNGILHKTATHTVNNLYLGYPRIVGETGGKDFHFCHTSADVDNFVNCTIRGAFEYQGQKCSACSRVYVPDTLWPEIEKKMVDILKQVKMGQADDFSCFMSAVIDKNSFENIKSYIQYAKDHPNEARIAFGGQCDDSKGYFVTPTLVVTTNPHFKLIEEEIFGPVLTVYVYPADKYEESLELCNKTSPYALTGAIFARDRYAIDLANKKLRHAAGNFYVNDKCTGAVVGQQPFGGGRASGTNDKAGSLLNLLRWVSARTVKETFAPYYSWDYPHMRGVQTTQSGEGDENAAKKRKL